jgi:two-component system KDP operon response regulator KdpE
MRRTRILVVDDEPAIRKLLRANLEKSGFDAMSAGDGAEALKLVEREAPDLLVLDIIMPRMDGFETCRRLREWSPIPIIMLSAKDEEQDKVKCLEIGADDYITKPFGSGELVARIKAVLRRTRARETAVAEPNFACGDVKINFLQRKVTMHGTIVKLTPTEYNLLRELALNAEKVLTYNQLLNRVWGAEYAQEREYLHVFTSRLRAKIEDDRNNPEYIVTIPGVGYKFQLKG